MLVGTGVMHEADNVYSIQSIWLRYQLVRFLITAHIFFIFITNLVALHGITGYVCLIINTSLLAGIESGNRCLLNSKVLFLFLCGHNEYKIVFSINNSIGLEL